MPPSAPYMPAVPPNIGQQPQAPPPAQVQAPQAPPPAAAPTTQTLPPTTPELPVSRIDPSQVPNPHKDLEDTGPFPFPPKDYLLQDFPPNESEYAVYARNPRIQCSLGRVPEYSSFIENAKVPWVVSLNPMGSQHGAVPVLVNTSTSIMPAASYDPSADLCPPNAGPLRCERCRAYFCAFVGVADQGHWKCNFCGMAKNSLPIHVQHDVRMLSQPQGDTQAAFTRAALTSQTVEYVVDGLEVYSVQHETLPEAESLSSLVRGGSQVQPQKMPIKSEKMRFLFCIELPSSIDAGAMLTFQRLLQALSFTIAEMAQAHGDAAVSFVTFSSAVHFYDFAPLLGKDTDAMPKRIIVGDTQSPFVPLPFTTRCWLSLQSDGKVIQRFLNNLPRYAHPAVLDSTTNAPKAALGAAVTCAQLILSQTGGHTILISSNGCTSGIGALKQRDENTLMKKVDEKGYQVANASAASWWRDTAAAAAKQRISFDFLLLSDSSNFVELGALIQLAHASSGRVRNVHKLVPGAATEFSKRTVAPLLHQLRSLYCRPIGHSGILRARVSKDTRVREYAGHFLSQSRQEIDVPLLTPSVTYTVEIEHEGSMIESKKPTAPDLADIGAERPEADRGFWYFQAALLYTTTSGSRRLRVSSLRIPVTNQYAHFFRSVSLNCAFAGMARPALADVAAHGVIRAKDALIDRLANLLFCYRRQCSSSQHTGQLILPESLKLLPLYVYALLKTRAFRSANANVRMDDKAIDAHDMLALPPADLVSYVYPFMADLTKFVEDLQKAHEFRLPAPAQLCGVCMGKENVHALLDPAGQSLFLYIPRGADGGRWGISDAGPFGVAVDKLPLQVQSLIRAVRLQNPSIACVPVCVLQGAGDVHEAMFTEKLIEDKTQDVSESYIDYLCQLHATIRELLLLN